MPDPPRVTDDASVPTPAEADQDTPDDQVPDAGSRDTDGAPQSIGMDDAFHLLQNSRRRAVLRYLLANPDQRQFRMRDLAEEIAAWEHDTTVPQLTSKQRQRVYIALYQSHLSKLDRHGIIDYNKPRGIVEPAALLAALAPFLEDGLHTGDESQRLVVEDSSPVSNRGNGHRPRLVASLASLFT